MAKIVLLSNPVQEKAQIVKSATEMLKSNHLLSLGTYTQKERQPWTSFAYYTFDKNFNLYIWTDPKARHSLNVKENARVSVNITNTTQEWGSLLCGMQIIGVAKLLSGSEALFAGALYLKRYSKASKFIKRLSDFSAKKYQSKLYKIEIRKIKILDEKSFGKEEYKELSIVRK
jgi:uncharacterized protein YhbP (UPF0306 family)